jgi:thymidylate synthase ThyX
MANKITLLRYTDPERINLAEAAAVYLGKSDTGNIRRPLTIMKKRHALAIFRGEICRFEFETSKVVYDHLITYTTADMRACAGLRANEAFEFVPPAEDGDDELIYKEIAAYAFDQYKKLIRGIDPNTDDPIKKKRLQAARSILPMSTKIKYQFQFNFLTLINIFQQRIWTPGAQLDTAYVVHDMWELVKEQDPELWSTVYEEFGPEEQSWIQVRKKLKREDPQLFDHLMDQ